MKKFLCLIFLSILLAACSIFSSALTDEDVTRYIKAYEAIAAASPELEKLKKQEDAVSLLTCGPCRARLEKAVQSVGYEDMKSFVAMDIRMHVTLRAWVYVTVAKLAGKAGQDVAGSDVCSMKEEIARSENPEEMRRSCARLKSYASYLDKLGAMAVQLAEKLIQASDIEVVGRHEEAIFAALTNEKLPAEYRHGRGGDFDD